MGNLLTSFKNLAAKIKGGDATAADISGDVISEVIDQITEDYTPGVDGAKGADGADGAPGAYVTAIELTVNAEGAVTGGTATLSDETTVNITVTTAGT